MSLFLLRRKRRSDLSRILYIGRRSPPKAGFNLNRKTTLNLILSGIRVIEVSTIRSGLQEWMHAMVIARVIPRSGDCSRGSIPRATDCLRVSTRAHPE